MSPARTLLSRWKPPIVLKTFNVLVWGTVVVDATPRAAGVEWAKKTSPVNRYPDENCARARLVRKAQITAGSASRERRSCPNRLAARRKRAAHVRHSRACVVTGRGMGIIANGELLDAPPGKCSAYRWYAH